MALTVPCTKCGHPIDLSPELAALTGGQPVAMQHGEGLCPVERLPDRQWRCEVRVFELTPCTAEGCTLEHQEGDERELFAYFAADAQATTLATALPALAEAIGGKWKEAIEKAPFADQPVLPDPPPDGEERRPAREWQERAGYVVVDPDGWREPGAPGPDEPITYDEFERRAASSTVAPWSSGAHSALDPPRVASGVGEATATAMSQLDAQVDALHGPGAAAAIDEAIADGSMFGAKD